MTAEKPEHDQLNFSGLRDDVREALENQAREIAERVFNIVWKAFKDQLGIHREHLDRIPEDRKEQIKTYLTNGFIKGRGRERDHSWGVDIMADECRKRVGATLVREIVPTYSSLDTTLPDPETFFQREIKPLMDAYDVPIGLLAYVSPALNNARRDQRRS